MCLRRSGEVDLAHGVQEVGAAACGRGDARGDGVAAAAALIPRQQVDVVIERGEHGWPEENQMSYYSRSFPFLPSRQKIQTKARLLSVALSPE